MKQKQLLFCCILFFSLQGSAQKFKLPKINFKGNNVVYFEAGGAGLSHSLNYDRRFKKNNPDGLGFRVGISNVIGLDLGSGGATIPVGLTYIKRILPQLPHTIEAGAGLSPYFPKIDKDRVDKELITTFSLMYRYQPLEKGIVIKVGFTPFISLGDYVSHWGAGLGYKF